MPNRPYQLRFYANNKPLHNHEGRLRKADKIVRILETVVPLSLSSAICVDVGCSSGVITEAIAPLFLLAIGVEYDQTALVAAPRNGKASFVCGDAMCLPIGSQMADLVVVAQVYEHVPDAVTLAREIYRIVKPGGWVYFSGPNKLFPIELHYSLPFLHWLPGKAADVYMRMLGKGEAYYERSRTIWGLRQLFRDFQILDISVEVLKSKHYNQLSSPWAEIASIVPTRIWKVLLPFFPNFNWLLHKPLNDGDSMNNYRR